MSINLKENQLIAAELLSTGMSAKIVSDTLNIRPETLSRWRLQKEFIDEVNNKTESKCSYLEKRFLKLYHLSLSVVEEVLTNNEISPNVRANTAMKYITNLGVDDTIKNKIVVKAAENHDSVKKVFDLIDELYAKCRKEAREEFSGVETKNEAN